MPSVPRQRGFVQGVKLYYRHQVKGTRPSPRVGKHAIVDVTDLESGEQFSMETKHAVLNVPTEVSPSTVLSLRSRSMAVARVGKQLRL